MRDTLQARIALCIARAQWWTTYANTPANKNRHVTDGGGRRYTEDEMIESAMQTANSHLTNAQEAFDKLNAAP